MSTYCEVHRETSWFVSMVNSGLLKINPTVHSQFYWYYMSTCSSGCRWWTHSGCFTSVLCCLLCHSCDWSHCKSPPTMFPVIKWASVGLRGSFWAWACVQPYLSGESETLQLQSKQMSVNYRITSFFAGCVRITAVSRLWLLWWCTVSSNSVHILQVS